MEQTTRIPRGESDWIQTATGRQFWPLDPQPEEISIIDIAHALSNICRFTGHVRRFYCVAEHSVRVSYEVEWRLRGSTEEVRRPLALWGLLHDATEAYLCDLARPLKRAPVFGPLYKAFERTLMDSVCIRFGLDRVEPAIVKAVDNALLETERRDLMNRPPRPWRDPEPPLDEVIDPWPPQTAALAFLKRFAELVPNDPELTGEAA